jgi:hypothetical protein
MADGEFEMSENHIYWQQPLISDPGAHLDKELEG